MSSLVYEEYLEELKSIANKESGKEVARLQEEMKPLQANFAEQCKRKNDLLAQLNKLKARHSEILRQREEREQERQRTERIESVIREEAKERMYKIGVILDILLTGAYIYILYGTDMFRNAGFGAGVNVGVFSLLIGVVSVIFLRKTCYSGGDSAGGAALTVIIVLQSFTTAVWIGEIGILAISFLINVVVAFVVNTICTIPSWLLIMLEKK